MEGRAGSRLLPGEGRGGVGARRGGWWGASVRPSPWPSPRGRGKWRLAGDGDVGEDARDDVVGLHAVELGLRLEDDAVAQDGRGDGLDVIWGEVVAAGEGGDGLAGVHQADCAADAGAVLHVGGGAGGALDLHDVGGDRVVHLDGERLAPELEDGGFVDQRLDASGVKIGHGEAAVVEAKDAALG